MSKEQLQYLRHAPKITSQDKEIHSNWSGTEILRRYRALGRLWANVRFDTKVTKRIVFEDISRAPSRNSFRQWRLFQKEAKEPYANTAGAKAESESSSGGMIESKQSVHFIAVLEPGGRTWPLLYVEEGDAIIMEARSEYLRVESITIEGQRKKAASKAMRSLGDYATWDVEALSEEQGVSAIPLFNTSI
jgi:methionyl-tRNA formyltransferase